MLPPSPESAAPLLEMRFPAQSDRLKLVRASVMAASRMCGFQEQEAKDIVLAVNEACQNVIVHGYRGRPDGVILLAIYQHDCGILLRLRDFAPPVDPAKVKPRDLCNVVPGGLGTHFIREIMDCARFVPVTEGGGNLFEMTKRSEQPT